MAFSKCDSFIKNTPRGSNFGQCASRSGEHCEDGTVTFNREGRHLYEYQSIQDYASHVFLGVNVVYLLSCYVGDRDDDGEITWFNDIPEPIDDNEDGSCVYSKPVLHADVDVDLLKSINAATTGSTLLKMLVETPELLNQKVVVELFHRKIEVMNRIRLSY